MLRRKGFLLSSVLVFLVTCGGQEQKAIDTYFRACRNGDEVAAAGVSAVKFPEKVQSWEIVEIGPESVVPFPLKEKSRKLREAKMDLKHIAEEDYFLLSENQQIYKRYKAQIEKDPDTELKGELADFQREFEALRKKGEEAERAVEESNRAVEREKMAARLSMMGAAVTDGLDGEVAVKEALVDVNGGKAYRITLKNYMLVNEQSQAKSRSRWVITDVQEKEP